MIGNLCDQTIGILLDIYFIGLILLALFWPGNKNKKAIGKTMPQKTYGQFLSDYNTILAAIKALSPVDTPSFETQMKIQSEILEKLCKEIASNPPAPTASSPGTEPELSLLQNNMITTLASSQMFDSQLRDNRKLLFQEAGQWARHFSTVRMTVMTFTITTCAALIAWKWQGVYSTEADNINHRDMVFVIIIPTAVLWVSGVLVFWFFTYYTSKEVDRQMEKRPLLKANYGENFSPRTVPLDVATFIVAILSLGLCTLIDWLASQGKITLNECWKKGMCGFIGFSFCVPFIIKLSLKRWIRPKRWKPSTRRRAWFWGSLIGSLGIASFAAFHLQKQLVELGLSH